MTRGRQALAVAALLVATAAAGCLDGGDGPARDGGEVVESTPDRVELVDCLEAVHLHEFSRRSVQALLPEPFSPRGLTSETATVNINHFDCQAAVVDNETTLPDVSITTVIAFVNLPSKLHTTGADDRYVLEWFTDNETFHGILAKHRMPAFLADITHTFQTGEAGGEATVAVGDEPWYVTTTQGGGGDQYSSSGIDLKFHHFTRGRDAWAFVNLTEGLSELDTRKSVTAVHGGVLSRLPEAAAGSVASPLAEVSTRNLMLGFGEA